MPNKLPPFLRAVKTRRELYSVREFYFDLIDVRNNATLAAAMLVILSNEDPGVVRFQEEEVTTVEEFQEKLLEVTVVRRHGAAGKVACAWRTEDNTAKAGTHYTAGSGVLEFEHGQMVAKLPLTVLPAGRYQLSSTVRILLSNITGGAKFDATTEGGRDLCIATVVIQPDPAVQDRIQRIHSALAVNWTKAHTAKSNWTAWKEQIIDAVKLTDDDEDEEEEEGQEEGASRGRRRGCLQYIGMAMTAVLVVPWKIFFAVIPPPGFCDGWLCFFCSLGGIGLLTAVVGDLAALLGCGCSDSSELVRASGSF
ncbi:Slc8a2 [Symbiodinium natans]|uniref:Slc8a2 protein n=1 Tax=Symbiodinium natans TaxID=878477 RepID=A0A812SIX0_9DINO|nr:Slc8a2 [Symbiodinium natans]